MSHLHLTAIAPLGFPWESLVKLRRNARRLWDTVHATPAKAKRIGAAGALFVEDAQFANFKQSVDFAADSTPLLRRNDAVWFPFTEFDGAEFAALQAQHGVRGTMTAHLALTRSATLSLIVSFNFPDISGVPGFDQRDVRRVFEQTFLTPTALSTIAALASEIIRPFFENDAPAPTAPRADATHVFTVLCGADESTISHFRRPHAEEEGTSESVRDAAGQSTEGVHFLRFGWSYTTLAVRTYCKEIALLPLMVYLQNLWFSQKTLSESVGYFAYDNLGTKRERTLAVELEALNIERTFAANEIEDYRSNLKPWLTAAFDFVFAKWGLAETRSNVEQVIGNLREYYERKLDVHDSRQNKRQASVLFWIALLQCTQMFANLAGYFYFLELSDIDVSNVTTSGLFIMSLVVSPIVLTVLSIFAAWLYFAEQDAKS